NDLKKFYELFYSFFEYLSKEIAPSFKHSLIFLLIENKLEEEYKTLSNYFTWFRKELDKLFSWNVINCKEPKIVNLPPIGKIEADMIQNWIIGHLKIPEVKRNLSCF